MMQITLDVIEENEKRFFQYNENGTCLHFETLEALPFIGGTIHIARNDQTRAEAKIAWTGVHNDTPCFFQLALALRKTFGTAAAHVNQDHLETIQANDLRHGDSVLIAIDERLLDNAFDQNRRLEAIFSDGRRAGMEYAL